jgi:hypothetical protein
MFARESSVMGVKELWKSRAPNKCRFFIWLSLLGRCWTTDRLVKNGLRSDDTCASTAKKVKLLIICYASVFSVGKPGSNPFSEPVGSCWCRRRPTPLPPGGSVCASRCPRLVGLLLIHTSSWLPGVYGGRETTTRSIILATLQQRL